MYNSKDTIKAVDNLRVGDKFTERLCHWVFVIDIVDGLIKVMTARGGDNLPEDAKITDITLSDFKRRYRYSKTNKKYWISYMGNDPIYKEFKDCDCPMDEKFLKGKLSEY